MDIQNKKLEELLEYANKNIPYYSGLFRNNTETPGFCEWPLIDKDLIREKQHEFVAKIGVNQRAKVSGGSTGAPVTVLKDSNGMAREMAATWRGYAWAGIEIGAKQARFWGVPRNAKERLRAKLIDFVCHRVRISAFGYDQAVFKKSADKINKFNPDYFYGYVSIIKDFSNFINDVGKLRNYPRAIICTSEVLAEMDRDIIERRFNSKVYNEYGCGEVGTIAHECEYGGMHVNSENIIVEILDDDGKPLPLGSPGEVVVTDLTNYSMPLIRYRLKDFAVLTDKYCKCGRTLPLIEKIYGRQYDTLKNRDGKHFHGEFFLYIIEDLKKENINVHGVQFRQKPNLDMEIDLVIDGVDFEKASEYICDRIKSTFDSTIDICVKKVIDIKREASGKLRVVKNCD